MTPDEIETAAIEAARKAVEGFWNTPDPSEDQGKLFSQTEIDRIFIRAYGRAMIQPGETAPKDKKPFLAWIKNGIPFVVQFNRETPLGGAEFIDPCGLLRTELYSRDIAAWQPLPRREGE